MRIHHFLYALIGLILCSLPLQGQSRQNISLKFMGLSFHPLSGRPNAKLMPNRLDPEAYFVVDLGALLSYEYFIIYNRQNEASGTKGTKRTKLKLLRRNEAYA